MLHDLMAGQLDIWRAQQFAPENPAYNIAEYLEIRGDLEVGLFTEALRRAAAEADALRLRFHVVDGVPKQYVDASAEHAVPVIDVSGGPTRRRPPTRGCGRTCGRPPISPAARCSRTRSSSSARITTAGTTGTTT
ncbi:condensation domain-containing protein [Actinomadura madurae]|uniref:condensation domain-containing protein n=1 Tax=Actinomadura madurae TaxID=1993 RepID=UPI0020D212C8|nr:condensation domain-containing protein [Actinomadura madurae]MCP9972081.1 condensation domain-containing protein [Actinomadura madurae]